MKKTPVNPGMLLTCLLAACAMGQTSSNETDAETKAAASGLKAESVPTPAADIASDGKPKGEISPGPGMQRLVDMAKKDMVAATGIAENEIEVLQAQYVSWPDSSIGCPQPGYQYLQVITNGSLILLRADKFTYYYHSGGNRPPFHCKIPSQKAPPPYEPGEI